MDGGGSVAHRAAIVRFGLAVAALAALAGAGWLAAQSPAGRAVPKLSGLPDAGPPVVRPFPEFDPAQRTAQSQPLPAARPAANGDPNAFPTSARLQPPAAVAEPREAEPTLGEPIGPDPFAEPAFAPRPAGAPGPQVSDSGQVNLPTGVRQRIRFGPRYSEPPSWKLLPSDDANVQKLLYTGGVIISVNYLSTTGAGLQEVEFAADNIVAWIKSAKKPTPSADLNAPLAESDAGGKSEVEFYLAGAVVIRQYTPDPRGKRPLDQVFSAPEVYYDVNNNKAVALDALMQFRTPGIAEPINVRGRVLRQLGTNEIEIDHSAINASRRPADPGLQYTASRSVFTREERPRRNIFGIEYRDLLTGEKDLGYEQILTSYNATPRIFNVPFFYLPRTRNDINEPFGPLAGFNIGNDRVFGFRVYTTFDLFKLSGLRGPQGHRWVLFADYLSLRGGATGTEYDYQGRDLFGVARRTGDPAYNQPYSGFFRTYYVQDTRKNHVLFPQFETDTLGGFRGAEPIPGQYRGRTQFRHNQDIYENGTTYLRVMGQIEHLSDKNFLEQYYKSEFDTQPNQETFAYLQAGAGNVFGSALLEQRLSRPWDTETNWRRADAAVVGQSFFDFFSYNARGSVADAELRPATITPLPLVVTDRPDHTGRFDLYQKLTAPFDLGPVRLAPYGVLDLTYYSQDLSNANGIYPNANVAGSGFNRDPFTLRPEVSPVGQSRGRFYGAGGVTAETTVSKLYATANSELFNVNGLYHKATLRGNYYNAYSNTPYYLLPQLDRLNDDTTDYTYRLTRPFAGGVIQTPSNVALFASPLYDPQQYAIRRLVDNKPDTLDTIQVAQLGLNQRLQTKRGYPGAQHVVDWMNLDVSASYFPDPARDNYGQSFGFLEYDYTWNFGDRVSFQSAGWADPIQNGAKYFNAGLNFNRPDGTNFFASYRQTDPLGSKSVLLSLAYQLNSKYSVNLLTIYDIGLKTSLANQLSFARVGADATLLFGLSYNPIIKNFGVQFALVPNLFGFSGGQLSRINSISAQR
jgi:hypothetical protein